MQILHSTLSRRLRLQGEERRKRIVSLVQSCAGIRYSELVWKTNLAHGTLSHHIKILERQKRIRVRRDNGSTRFFPDSCDDGLCNAISSASHTTTMTIMALLLRRECSYGQIKNMVRRSGSTVCEHLKRLLSAGLVSRRRVDSIWVYGVTDVNRAIMIMNTRRMN